MIISVSPFGVQDQPYAPDRRRIVAAQDLMSPGVAGGKRKRGRGKEGRIPARKFRKKIRQSLSLINNVTSRAVRPDFLARASTSFQSQGEFRSLEWVHFVIGFMDPTKRGKSDFRSLHSSCTVFFQKGEMSWETGESKYSKSATFLSA